MATAAIAPVTSHLDLSESFYEVIDGLTIEKPRICAREQGLAFLLAMRIASVMDSARIGRVWPEMLFEFRPIVDRQRRPDVAFVSAETWPFDKLPPIETAWRVIPDLAIEIISQTNLAGDMEAKVEEYFTVGVSQVWVIYPMTRRIYVYASPSSVRIVTCGETLTENLLLPGFQLDLDEFFGPTE